MAIKNSTENNKKAEIVEFITQYAHVACNPGSKLQKIYLFIFLTALLISQFISATFCDLLNDI